MNKSNQNKNSIIGNNQNNKSGNYRTENGINNGSQKKSEDQLKYAIVYNNDKEKNYKKGDVVAVPLTGSNGSRINKFYRNEKENNKLSIDSYGVLLSEGWTELSPESKDIFKSPSDSGFDKDVVEGPETKTWAIIDTKEISRVNGGQIISEETPRIYTEGDFVIHKGEYYYCNKGYTASKQIPNEPQSNLDNIFSEIYWIRLKYIEINAVSPNDKIDQKQQKAGNFSIYIPYYTPNKRYLINQLVAREEKIANENQNIETYDKIYVAITEVPEATDEGTFSMNKPKAGSGYWVEFRLNDRKKWKIYSINFLTNFSLIGFIILTALFATYVFKRETDVKNIRLGRITAVKKAFKDLFLNSSLFEQLQKRTPAEIGNKIYNESMNYPYLYSKEMFNN